MNAVVAGRCARAWAVVCSGFVCGIAWAAPADVATDRIFADAFELPPIADFNSNPIGFQVTFADQSTDPSGTVGAWSWDFGDGTTANVPNPVHDFPAAGTYTVTESVVDAVNGESGTVSKSVSVVPCGTLTSYLHDFRYAGTAGGHPDFESFNSGLASGLVELSIAPRGVPLWKSNTGSLTSASLSGAANFAQWFVDDPINFPIQQTLTLAESPPGTFSYSTLTYFPIDNEGFGNSSLGHNFSFTTMLHTQFTLHLGQGQMFSFTGNDDVWVFVNGHLAIDLGGVHGAATGTVTLDAPHAVAFGLTDGQTYPLDFFQAQRHTSASYFTIQTNLCLGDAR